MPLKVGASIPLLTMQPLLREQQQHFAATEDIAKIAPCLQAIREVRGASQPTQVEPIERANPPQGTLTAPNSNHRQIFDCQVRIVLQHPN